MHDCKRLLDAIERYIAKADDDLEEILAEEGFAEPGLTVARMSQIEEAVAEALEQETELFITSAETAIDVQEFADRIWPGVQLDDDLAEKLTTIFTEQLNEFLPQLIEPYLQQTDKELTLTSVSKKTTAWVSEWSEELGSMMKLTSHTEIENILAKNLKDGNGIQDFISDIQNSGIREERYRARRAAVTESLRAHSVAQEESIQQSPAVEDKEWVHTGSFRNDPRPNHQAMSGQIVPKNEPFTLTGADGSTYYPQYPRDPILPASESVNCHCIHRGIVSEKILGLPIEERRRLQAEAIAEMDEAWEAELNAKNRAKAGIE
ncbi:MAG: hypothetical protein IKY62_04400 [Clostridia bacterium]|nr:hypothetical protein [Clostridia bacterium]